MPNEYRGFFYSNISNQPMSLEAYETDIYMQPDFVKSFQIQDTIPAKEQQGVIFAGSGDSLAVAMLAESFSGIVRAMDPLDLLKNHHISKKKTYFVSISGNTSSNIRAARTVPYSVAITAAPDSRLAKTCPESISLHFPSCGIFTAGSIGFLCSALTCISMVKRFEIPRVDQIFARAKAAAKSTKLSNKIFILGNLQTYPLAMYCAAKFYEILGADARYCRIEQFSHMELFSANKGDTIIIFEQSAQTRRLAKHLKSAGLNVSLPKFSSTNEISNLLFLVFYSQFLPLFAAKRSNRNECHFVLAKKFRSVSNSMIY